MFLTMLALVVGLTAEQDGVVPEQTLPTSSPSYVSVSGGYFFGTPRPHFVFPFQEKEHQVQGWFTHLAHAKDTTAVSITGLYVPKKSSRALAYSGEFAVDFNSGATRFGINLFLWGSQNQFQLASTSIVAIGSTHANHGLLLGPQVGHGSLSNSYIRLGPSAGAVYVANDFTLTSSGASARDAINHTILPLAGVTALAGMRAGPVHLKARANTHWIIQSERAWGTTATSVQLWGNLRVWRNFSFTTDAVWSTPVAFEAVPLNKRVSIGLGWNK